MPRSLISLLLFSIAPILATAQNFQYATRFPQSKLYSLSPESIGLANVDGTIAAFGDFNGDKFTDVFILGSDQQSISVYTWNHQNFTFQAPSTPPQIHQKDFIITNIVPGDFTYDGKLDLLVMGQTNPNSKSSQEIQLRIYVGNGNDTFESEFLTLPSAYRALPMVLDINGDMKLDLLGYASKDTELSMWINTVETPFTNQTSIFNVTSASDILDKKSTDKCVWANPHSNAVVDLNGDCLADLVFVCEPQNGVQSLQIWTNGRDQGFSLAHELVLPKDAGPLSFADIDGDGSMDIVFPVHGQSGRQIHVAYNQQMGLCTKSQENDQEIKSCRKAQNLCVADDDFKFSMTTKNSENYVVFSLDGHIDPDEDIQIEDSGFEGHWPVAVQPGDYNLDGYPDLLVTTTKKVLLLESTLCTNLLCSEEATRLGKRTFSVVEKGAEDLMGIKDPRHAVFFDIDENGSLDILVLQATTSSGSAQRTPNFIVNNYFNDAFFLKGLVSNGVCAGGSCPGEIKPYGVSYPGATLKFTVLDTSGTKRAHQVTQLSQSSYLRLQTPYCLFGLGRTNNYVEEMFAGVSRHQQHNYLFYEGVIPNSQLIFLPYQPDDVQDSSTWKVELYVHPGDYIPWVLAILIAAALLLGVVVGVLYWMEKREDEMERRKALHIINFDAL